MGVVTSCMFELDVLVGIQGALKDSNDFSKQVNLSGFTIGFIDCREPEPGHLVHP